MRIIDTNGAPMLEKLPGWHGQIFHGENMTFAHWRFDTGAAIHPHHHEQEEVWHVVEGELEATVDGEARIAGPGMVLMLAPNETHAIIARTAGFAIVADHPARKDFGR